jgi:hypothetical protein
MSSSSFDRRVEWVKSAAGGRATELEFLLLTFFVSVGKNRTELLTDRSALRGSARNISRQLADLPVGELRDVPAVLLGSVAEISETLIERRARYGFNYWVVHEEFESFAPVVAALAGT